MIKLWPKVGNEKKIYLPVKSLIIYLERVLYEQRKSKNAAGNNNIYNTAQYIYIITSLHRNRNNNIQQICRKNHQCRNRSDCQDSNYDRLMLPGSLVTLFGSVSGIIAIILAVEILILFFLFLITLIISCILIKKKKLLADAWMKLIIFLIFTCISALFIQVGEITVLMIIPVILAGIVLIKLYVHK